MPIPHDVATPSEEILNFGSLVNAIQQTHAQSAAAMSRVVNVTLTLRNWVIGAYIVEYEMRGEDRAKYGDGLMTALANRLTDLQVSNCNSRQLYRYLRFFQLYPQIAGTLPPQLPPLLNGIDSIASKDREPIVGTLSPLLGAPAKTLVERLSYSHLELIVDLDDPLKRAFYEIECIRGNWSVRALKRQISSLYFERSGLSLDKDKLSAMANEKAEPNAPQLTIRDPYIFEFLGLKPTEAVAESDLEQALLDNLQEFLLELGHGFCLEARQKSIVIGTTRGFVDLVFYHRILKCHVLVELKVDEFRHEHLGQLNTYVAWYQKNLMQDGDNPPVGLLLCTGKDHALVEYALSSMNHPLFVSKYQFELPSKETLQQFLQDKRKEVSGEI
jgi:predicted nuclease of restriction endonuclease-like (RecB) superfamily